MRGTMLWFNAAKDRGELRTDGGDQLAVPGAAFAAGEKPIDRCAGKVVEFDASEGAVSGVAFVAEVDQRRARRRQRR